MSLALAAILSLQPTPVDVARVEQLATDIEFAVAVASANHVLPFEGEYAPQQTILLLVSVAKTESDFDPLVFDCIKTGDRGRSISAFQLMRGMAWYGHTREELCASGSLAAFNAIRVLRHHALRTRFDVARTVRGYCSGDPGKPSEAATRQHRIFLSLAEDYGFATEFRKGIR